MESASTAFNEENSQLALSESEICEPVIPSVCYLRLVLLVILTRNKGTVFKPSYKMPYNRKKKLPQKTQLDSTGESISAKGFHRPQKHYLPPVDVSEKIESVYKSVTGASNLSGKSLDDSSVKFQILNECSKEFQHSVPNSLLSTIHTMEDVVEFYKTPVHKIAPLDAMKNMDLPENLHIQTEYHRFHPVLKQFCSRFLLSMFI
ncbi:hypothetical protein ANN_15093 [Periplaneta americana]|uniref:Large ribosomal subunit protein mL50 n=1 Tax=Periplaneta americana TaxID=6978 RepID=A0ABQ8SY94_PERAM|nr:hypothetical protein ANN_15093 [Periplaneta americana]